MTVHFEVGEINICESVCQGHVVMGNNAVSPYQQVIEKTKSLSFRSQMLAMNIEKKVAHSNRNEVNFTLFMFIEIRPVHPSHLTTTWLMYRNYQALCIFYTF